ncbi:hypothetical protein [Streptomyces sp. NPDC052721]
MKSYMRKARMGAVALVISTFVSGAFALTSGTAHAADNATYTVKCRYYCV